MPSTLRPAHPVPRSLSQLAANFELSAIGDIDGVEVAGISLSTDDIAAGDLYVGMPGTATHGARFARTARDRGAVAILTDADGATLAADGGLPILITAHPRVALGAVSAWVYRTDENLPTLYAVTGTNGKTSVVYLLDAVLRQLGVVTGLTSTAERRIGQEAVPSSLTTPEASELHALLARMREAGVRAATIEVSAQALVRNRVDGLLFDVVGFTNLSHDHLDDFADLDEYFSAKQALFDPDRAVRGVVTVDTAWGRRLAADARIPVVTLSTARPGAPDQDADWRLIIEKETQHYTRFTLQGLQNRRLTASVPLFGWFMAANAALAIVMLVESGYDLDAIEHALQRDGGIDVYIPGRAERVSGERGPAVYIDYGHTPDAFENTLAAIRSFTSGRVVMVFGADGDRDTSKRADMGAIAARGADVVIVTDFHPRYEDPAAIRAALLAGARAAVPERELYEVPDPRAALRQAVALAGEGDSILFAGPGHEDYQEIAGVKHPYSARNDARLALGEAGWQPDVRRNGER